MKSNGVEFLNEIENHFYGKTACFPDLYGNQWCLVQPTDLSLFDPDKKILRLVYLTYMAKDLDEARDWYVNKLGFHVLEDKAYEKDHRWLVISPSKDIPNCSFTLCPANTEEGLKKLGTQLFLLNVSDIQSFYENATNDGVKFNDPPKKGYGGTDAQFKDLYGNSWNAREHAKGFK